MNKKLWKRVIAFLMAYAIVTGIVGMNTALAARNEQNIAVANRQKKVNGKAAKETESKKNIKEAENTPEFNRILEEGEEVKPLDSSRKINKGQMMSMQSVTSISMVEECCMAIMSNGDLYCWGRNEYGQVGNGTREDQTTPVKVLSDVKSVSCPDDYRSVVSAITENGDLYCWGYNGQGQIGNGTRGDQTTPVKVLSDVKSVSCYSDSSVSAITENGDLYCWGKNAYGQVGNGTTESQTTPVKVLSDVKSASYLSSYLVSAITKNGDLYCWGYNGQGQVGNGTTETQTTPVRVLSNVKSVSYPRSPFCSDSSVLAITEKDDLYCWGYNEYGQVGNGTREDQTTPVKVLSDVKSVSYSYNAGFVVSAITNNGDLYCWGGNAYGQVGNGTTESQTTPVKVLGDVKFASCHSSALAITEKGDLYCRGGNAYGQVGNGTTETQTTPVKVLSNVKFGSYLLSSMSAITENGDLYCWGENAYGQVGNGTTKKQLIPTLILGPSLASGSDKPSTPTADPTAVPTTAPTTVPSTSDTAQPTVSPTIQPTPTTTEEPISSVAPAATQDPGSSVAPAMTQEPISSIEPAATEEPVSSIEPVDTEEPYTPDETVTPTKTPKPAATKKPQVSDYYDENSEDEEDNIYDEDYDDFEEDSDSSKKVKKGTKIKNQKANAVFKVTKTGKNKTVEYIKPLKKNAANVKIPATVKLKGKTYKVASVGNGAFQGNKKLTQITLGKNIKKIGDKAFYNCKNLRYILVKAKKLNAKNVGKIAFGKGSASLRVKTDKDKWKQYLQIFLARGMSKKAVFVIDPVKLVI